MNRLSRHRGNKLGLATAAAVGLHAVIVTTVVFGAGIVGSDSGVSSGVTGKPVDPLAAAKALSVSCSGDVMLATSARAMLCLAPWGGDLAGCGDELQTAMWIDLSSCRRGSEPVAEVAMVSQRAVEKVKSIDPEQLLEEMAKQPPPPPPPQIQPAQPQVPQPPPPPPPQAPPRPAQVIETVKPNTEEEPENARFLAEYNTKVEKQQVSRGARNEPMVAKAKPEELKATDRQVEDPTSAKPPTDRPVGTDDRAPDQPGPLAMRKPGAINPQESPQDAKSRGTTDGATGPAATDGYNQKRGGGEVEQQRRDPGEQVQGQGGAGGGAPQLPDLNKSKDVLERIAGGGSVDHLDDVEEGDESALNAKKWVYASFFNRVKRQVAQTWDPETVLRRADPDGTKSGVKSRITGVKVTLSATGALLHVSVMSPSGVSELDEEAMRAFRVSAPFPNPPEGLAKNGQIVFDFGFYLEVGGRRTSWRVNRQ